MKKFKLEVDGVLFEARGETIDQVEGWENGMPELWRKNISKIQEEDMTAELLEVAKVSQRWVEVVEFADANLELLKEMVANHGKQ